MPRRRTTNKQIIKDFLKSDTQSKEMQLYNREIPRLEHDFEGKIQITKQSHYVGDLYNCLVEKSSVDK